MEPTLGEIRMFGGNFAPRSWALCEGQLLPINSNPALFSILGTTYGGDGRTTFGLPDMRGRTAIHAGHGPGLSDRRLGSKGGTEFNTITVAQLASHSHDATFKANKTASTVADPANAFPAPMAGRALTTPPANVQMSGYGTAQGANSMSAASIVVGNTGGNQSVNNMQPWLCVNYIIALQGIFPSRS
jgi:microcystin-dependent protein